VKRGGAEGGTGGGRGGGGKEGGEGRAGKAREKKDSCIRGEGRTSSQRIGDKFLPKKETTAAKRGFDEEQSLKQRLHSKAGRGSPRRRGLVGSWQMNVGQHQGKPGKSLVFFVTFEKKVGHVCGPGKRNSKKRKLYSGIGSIRPEGIVKRCSVPREGAKKKGDYEKKFSSEKGYKIPNKQRNDPEKIKKQPTGDKREEKIRIPKAGSPEKKKRESPRNGLCSRNHPTGRGGDAEQPRLIRTIG